jgi:hypothetical protein
VLARGVLPITRVECAESDLPDVEAAQQFLSQDRKAPAPVADPAEEEDFFGQLE